jgi:ribosomal protein L6P/L9E
VEKNNNQLLVKRRGTRSDARQSRPRRAVLANHVKGVSEGFNRSLDIVGVATAA